MLGFVIYGIGYFVVTLLIQYMLFKLRKNHNHGPNGIWVGSSAIIVLCVIGIINHPQSNKIMHFSYQKSAPLFAFLLIIERF